ncbi:hypothetical protein JT306_10070 [Salmonella enterica subsp. enterica serovar Kentucky]|nr:hypothetical protein [Salmonella enterica subsp. enterica serovar Kentucky]
MPGGMLTNLESQLKQQNAADKLDQCWRKSPRARGPRLYPAGDPDLADCRHPGGAQRPDRRALQNHCQRNRWHSERRIRPHSGAGKRGTAGPRAGRGRSGDLPPGGPAEAGTG